MLISPFLGMNPLQTPETGTSTFSQVNPTLEWPHKAMSKLDFQQWALAQAPGEGFWQTRGRKLVAQNVMDDGDVKSGCVLKIKPASYRLKNLLRVAVSLIRCHTLDLHILWPWLPALRAGKCLGGCQENPASQNLHLFGEHLPLCVTNKPLLTEKHRESVPCSFPSLIVQPAHTRLC